VGLPASALPLFSPLFLSSLPAERVAKVDKLFLNARARRKEFANLFAKSLET